MSHESSQSPVSKGGGLSTTENHRAAELLQRRKKLAAKREKRAELTRSSKLASPILKRLNSATEPHLARAESRAKAAAKEHYRQHEGAYQAEAIKMDAERTKLHERMEQLLAASPEEMGSIAASLGFSESHQRAMVQHTAERQATNANGETDRVRGIEALESVPGTDPVLALADGKPGEIPEEGWLVASHIAPGYGGRVDIYRYGRGQLELNDPSDNREKYGEIRVHFGIRGGDAYTVAYENPDFPGKDIEPFNRMSQTSYIPSGFANLDIAPLSNGGRLLDEKTTHPTNLFTSMDWRDFSNASMREHSQDFPVNRVVADQAGLAPILTALGEGMGLGAQDIETFVGAVDKKITPVQA